MAKNKGKLKRNNSDTTYYKIYPNRYLKNRIARLEKHLRRCPDDSQAQDALQRAQKGTMAYRRTTPRNHWLTSEQRQMHALRRRAHERQFPKPRVDSKGKQEYIGF